MKAYVAFKFKEDYSDKESIEKISDTLHTAGLETVVMVRDYEKWGAVKMTPQEFMPLALRAIDDCDVFIADFSEKGVGLGIEAGYAYARKKPIIVIAKEGVEISDTLKGISKQVIFYTKPEDLAKLNFHI
ncbi:MAG: nucleoside 2-deoxyribosyltransferase [Patescibacteria group bacterium]